MKAKEPIIDKKEAIRLLREIDEQTSDTKQSHATADQVLLRYLDFIGHEDVADEFRKARNRAGFYYT